MPNLGSEICFDFLEALKHPFYTPARLGLILRSCGSAGNAECVLGQVADAKGACVARHRAIFELVVGQQGHCDLEILIDRFVDSYKERALVAAFIAPLQLVFQNDPEITANLEAHGKAFWAEIISALTGSEFPIEDAVDLDGGWSWGARNLLDILARSPDLAGKISRSVWSVETLGGPYFLESSSEKFGRFDFFFPFVNSGRAGEFRGVLDSVRDLTIDPEIFRLLVQHANLFLRYFVDRAFVARHLIDFLANQEAWVQDSVGFRVCDFASVLETGEVKYSTDALMKFLESRGIRLFYN